MSSANLNREETAARAQAINLHTIALSLDLSEAPNPEVASYPSCTTLVFDATTPTTWLDFLGESVDSVSVNGQEIPVEWDGARIALTGLAEHNTVVVRAHAFYSRSGEGLHRYVDPEDGNTYLYTQYEPADSRRVMACFEQPDMKASFELDVTAPREWIVLGNGEEVSCQERGEVSVHRFAPTKKLSSYITAVAAGPYYQVRDQWEDIKLSVLCRASLAPYLDADEVFEVTKQGLEKYHELFAYRYPWGKYDQIFVPEYNLGAMENPGLVTFTERYVFRGASSEEEHEQRANTILHEMAHMWFGDLVTMQWWDDLWLKESFAEFMGTYVCAEATKFTSAWVRFANGRKAWAYTQDQLPTTHPIVADIPDLEAAKLNFDGITYAKGAAVLKQLVAYVGEDAFFAAARSYFAAHAFGNARCEDFLHALAEASGRDMDAWNKAWLLTSGISTMELEVAREFPGEDGAEGEVELRITQSDPRPHVLRLSVMREVDATFAPEGRTEPDSPLGIHERRVARVHTQELDLSEVRTLVRVPRGDLYLLNDGDLTYAKVRLDSASLATAEKYLSTVGDEMARAVIWAALWNQVRDGLLAPRRFIAMVADHASRASNTGILQTLLEHVAYALDNYLDEAQAQQTRKNWIETLYAGMWQTSGDTQLVWARAFAKALAYSEEYAALSLGFLDGTNDFPIDLATNAPLRWQLICSLAAHGTISTSAIEEAAAQDTSSLAHVAKIQALASIPRSEVRTADWVRAWGDETLSNDELSALITGFKAGHSRELIHRFDAEYYERISDAWASRSIEMARRLVRDLFPQSATTELADRWLEYNEGAPQALRRIILEQRDNLARAILVREAFRG